jgi:hypothetical protein
MLVADEPKVVDLIEGEESEHEQRAHRSISPPTNGGGMQDSSERVQHVGAAKG